MHRTATFLALLAAMAVPVVLAQEKKAPPPVSFQMRTDQKYNLVVLADSARAPEVTFTGWVTNSGDATLPVTGAFIDLWGKDVQPVAGFTLKPGEARAVEVRYTPRQTGAWTLLLTARAKIAAEGAPQEQAFKACATVAVVPPPIPGPRAESFFASNTHPGGSGERAEFHHLVGLKVYRNHFADPSHCQGKLAPKNIGDPFEINWEPIDRMMKGVVANEMTFGVGIIGYAFPGNEEAQLYHQYGPPRDNQEFANIVSQIIARYNYLVPYWEIWNEPWIYGWTFAGPPATYQDLHKRIIATTQKLGCNAQFICGHSASFLADNIMPDPECAKGCVAESNHPYKEGGDPSLRRGAQVRYIDYGLQMGKAFGFKKHFITENGTEVQDAVTGGNDSLANCAKLVVLHAQAALCGIYQNNIQEGIGWGQGQPRGNVAFAVVSRMLEDRPVVADVWPAHPLIWGAIFANPRHITDEVRKLPRAQEISARWTVPVPIDRAADVTKVAVVWCYTGPNETALDADGTLTIADAADIQAFDLAGVPTGTRHGKALTIPFGQYPVYLTTDKLGVMEFHRALQGADIRNVTPLNFAIEPVPAPVGAKPTVSVLVQNQLNRPVRGTATLRGPKGWSFAAASVPLALEPAEIKTLSFPLAAAAPDDANLYPLTVSADTDAGRAERAQVVQVAQIAKRTIAVDGDLADWKDVVPVSLDSDQIANVEDWTRYALNPNLKRPTAEAAKPHVAVKAWAAYDDQNVYLAYAITEPELKNDSGKPWGNPPHPKYRKNWPDGIGFPIYGSDCIEAVFGIRDRAEDNPRKPDDPWYWKGNFRDTDYQYLIYTSTEGPQLIRIHKPDTPYRVSYQCVLHPGQGPVEGGKAIIRRDEAAKVTYYEVSLPRTELPLFRPDSVDRVRYGFLVGTDEGVGKGGLLFFSQACGVFDYWLNTGSFQPTWNEMSAAQTPWGVGK